MDDDGACSLRHCVQTSFEARQASCNIFFSPWKFVQIVKNYFIFIHYIYLHLNAEMTKDL